MRKLLYKEAVYLVAGPTLGGAGVQAISLQSVLGRLPVPAGRLGGGGEGHWGGFKGEGVEPARGCLGTRGGRLAVRAVFPGLPWEGKPAGEPQ